MPLHTATRDDKKKRITFTSTPKTKENTHTIHLDVTALEQHDALRFLPLASYYKGCGTGIRVHSKVMTATV